jgi:hypothetical protein
LLKTAFVTSRSFFFIERYDGENSEVWSGSAADICSGNAKHMFDEWACAESRGEWQLRDTVCDEPDKSGFSRKRAAVANDGAGF